MIPSPLAAVVFDMDGLLLDTEAFYQKACFEACATLGYEMPMAIHLQFIGKPKDGEAALFAEHFGADFPLADFYKHRRAHFEALAHKGVPAKSGARELLQFLKARGIPRGVATSTGRSAAEDHLKRAGLFDLLDTLVTRNDVTMGKPHPESFLKVAAQLGVDPAQCLALEDSYTGIRAASSAGMKTIMVPDLLEPTDEVRSLCVGILQSLTHVQDEIMATTA